MNNISVTLPPEQFSEMCGKVDGLSYALQTIIKRALQKVSYHDMNSYYGSDYNDCHGDYYDSEYN